MIGLVGAHRSGKTTLATAFAQRAGYKFVRTDAGSVFKDKGLDPALTYDFSTRLEVQEEILRRFDSQYATVATSNAVTDRTPLDLLAYTLAEVSGNTLKTEGERNRLKRYIDACIDVTNRRFSALLVIQPGIEVVAAEGKGALCPHYIEHFNSIVLGLTVDERIRPPHFYIPRSMTGLEDRVGALGYAVKRSIAKAATESQEAVIH